MVRVLINVPKQVKRGEPFDVKLLISHPMESGQRHDDMGQPIPRDIINSFVCTYNGEDVLRADLFPAIAANPFIAFFTTVTVSGKFEFEWIGDNGFSETASASITVE